MQSASIPRVSLLGFSPNQEVAYLRLSAFIGGPFHFSTQNSISLNS
jgi:hypothetical protein